ERLPVGLGQRLRRTEGPVHAACVIHSLRDLLGRIRLCGGGGQTSHGRPATVDTSKVPSHQVGGDSVEPREGAFRRGLHVDTATPRVKKGGRQEILRGATVTCS